MSTVGEVADQDMAAVRMTREKLSPLLMHLEVRPRDTHNFDNMVLYISVLSRKTYGNGRTTGRKVPKERLTVGFLVNDDQSHAFRQLVISKAKRHHDFRLDFDLEENGYWRNNAKRWMTSLSTIQRCWWRTGCQHMEGGNGGNGNAAGNVADIGLDEEVNDIGILIDQREPGLVRSTAHGPCAVRDA
ncbi:unnamed protein product [Closterium sp. Yama58-4]|nr:unnamed protein product [Closterium sp. Yama58-4]